MFEDERSGDHAGTQPTSDAAGFTNPASIAETAAASPAPRRTRRKATKAAAPEAPPIEGAAASATSAADASEPAERPVRRRRKATLPDELGQLGESGRVAADEAAVAEAAEQPVRATRARRSRSTRAAEPVSDPALESAAPQMAAVEPAPQPEALTADEAVTDAPAPTRSRGRKAAPLVPVLFMPPAESTPPPVKASTAAASRDEAVQAAPAVAAAPTEETAGRTTRRRRRRGEDPVAPVDEPLVAVIEPTATPDDEDADPDTDAETDADLDGESDEDGAARRRRRRGRRGRGRGRGVNGEEYDETEPEAEAEAEEAADEDGDGEGLTRRRRRRRRKGSAETDAADEPHVVVKIREPRGPRDEVQGVSGSTRLEAKRQRRRDGREQRRTRPPILTESEFLARREAVDRVMVVRQRGDRTQIAVLEDKVLVEHYVARASSATMVGNVYLGRVQNVLPSMEAAFVDIGRGRNAVLYAGEVNWDATGLEGRTRTIEQALRSGDPVLVQVTKDPIGTKGARLTSHIALSGRHLVYVPHGNASGISRKLSDIERKRLRDVLKNLVPDGAGVIVRTAAEGASEDDLARDVKRLQAQWEAIQTKAGTASAPSLLYEEPDLVIRVVRDLFNEDFRDLTIQGNEAFEMVEPYLSHVSPDLVDRVHRYTGTGDVFAEMRIDEQLIKALDRRVFLPSGGHLVIDRTEAMTVVDVNTGKYTGAGGNLEETVTRNNLEAAEEIVHQLRLRDLGGIIVIDFIDMVLESNRELVLRRLTECLGRDRTKHQVTEITSLGLVQMTRKRVGHGLLEAFSETCEVCKGRGLIIHTEPVGDRRGAGAGAAVAKVAAASGPNGGDAEPEQPRGRRRGRRGGAVSVEDEPVTAALDDDVEPVDEAPDPDEPSLVEVEDVELVQGDAQALAEDDDEDVVAGGGRRRTRRGVRRRTRP